MFGYLRVFEPQNELLTLHQAESEEETEDEDE